LAASVEDPDNVTVDDIHVEVTLGSTTLRLDPLASELGTTFTSLALCFQIWHIFSFESFLAFAGKLLRHFVTLA